MKKFINKILFPNKFVGLFFFTLGFGLLIFVFSLHLEETPISYASYVLSTYALILFCIWFYKSCKSGNEYIKQNSKLYKAYNDNYKIMTKRFIYVSLSINLIYGIFKLSTGIYYKSVWFITFAVYYLLLCFMKFSLIKTIKKDEFGHNLKNEYKKLKLTGTILLLLDIVLSGMIILIIHQNQTFVYPGTLIYIVALYDFYLIISALINVFKHIKFKSPILSANKFISLTVAMISMISLEVAMIYQFGSNDSEFKLTMTSITGFIVAIINSVMAIYMIVKANKNLK